MCTQGRILWTMGGAKRDDPKEARAHFEIASCEECDSQARSSAFFFLFEKCSICMSASPHFTSCGTSILRLSKEQWARYMMMCPKKCHWSRVLRTETGHEESNTLCEAPWMTRV